MGKKVEDKVYSADQINFSVSDLDIRLEPSKILMCTPDFFDVVDVKNVHMEGKEGNIQKQMAAGQWQAIREVYQGLVKEQMLEEYAELFGAEGCEDMVFAANQSFPWITRSGERVVIMSRMRHASRQREVAFFRDFYKHRGYRLIDLEKTDLFEGMGDAIPHPLRYLIYGGYGHRTDRKAYDEISDLLEVPVIPLELVNEKFYHLDTCFLPLDDETVFLFEGAFSSAGIDAIRKMFTNIISVPEHEAADNFALNAHVLHASGKKAAVIHQGSPFTVSKLKEFGYDVFEVDTSEFMKSGGSVFCMKMMIY